MSRALGARRSSQVADSTGGNRGAHLTQHKFNTVVIVNDDGTISLVCGKRSELIDQSREVVWHKNLLAEVR
jgi:hypothetical protein